MRSGCLLCFLFHQFKRKFRDVNMTLNSSTLGINTQRYLPTRENCFFHPLSSYAKWRLIYSLLSIPQMYVMEFTLQAVETVLVFKLEEAGAQISVISPAEMLFPDFGLDCLLRWRTRILTMPRTSTWRETAIYLFVYFPYMVYSVLLLKFLLRVGSFLGPLLITSVCVWLAYVDSTSHIKTKAKCSKTVY